MPTVKLATNLFRAYPIEGENVKKRHVLHHAGELLEVTDEEMEQFPFLGEALSKEQIAEAEGEEMPENVIGVPREPLELPRPLKPVKAKPSPRKG